MKQQLQLRFDNRFLDQYTGKKLLRDPIIAMVELVANCWDAGATRVDISWPDGPGLIEIEDNGIGMTEEEFTRRWMTLSYNRLKEQGQQTQIAQRNDLPMRKTFGENGIGRFAGFCFANQYMVTTRCDGKEMQYHVRKGNSIAPVQLIKISESSNDHCGTSISVHCDNLLSIPPAGSLKTELGVRFLTDPNFEVYVNSSKVDFDDLPQDSVDDFELVIPNIGVIHAVLIDAMRTDRTTKQHGIAWRVKNRLVGECSWHGGMCQSLIDGRRIEAKRYTFIVFADCLSDAVLPDWTGFREENSDYKKVREEVENKVYETLLGLTKEKRKETTQSLKTKNADKLRLLAPISREKWTRFIDQVQEQCPSLTLKDLEALAALMANLELAQSRFGLIHKLHTLKPGQLNDLHSILDNWTIDTAKIVLDELQMRLELINELHIKTSSDTTLEVQQLQPLFHRGLWIFGPEFETIEFTSNEGMTRVIQKLFDKNNKGSMNRPDFAIIPDGTVGLYSYSEFDDSHSEIGVARLVIVELKKPAISIGETQKAQCWKYVKELYEKGCLTDRSRVDCYVLGSLIEQNEAEESTHKNGTVRIKPLLFDTILSRAKSRVLRLYEKVRTAPFLQEHDFQEFLDFDPVNKGQITMVNVEKTYDTVIK